MTNSASPHATVLTVLNLKGGVGKTHTTWLLASVSHERGKRLLAIDTDPQGNLTNSFLREGEKTPGVERLLDPSTDADVHGLIRLTQYPTIDIIPASSAVVRFDLSDQLAWEQADLHRSFVEPVNELRGRYDLIVFDCPPRLSLTSFAALCASDFVIVPLEAADWGAQGIMQVTAAIDYVRSRFNVSFRQACVKIFRGAGIVGCRSSNMRRTADEREKDRGGAGRSGEHAAAFGSVAAATSGAHASSGVAVGGGGQVGR